MMQDTSYVTISDVRYIWKVRYIISNTATYETQILCLTKHRLVCAAFRFLELKKKKWKGMRKIKIWKLKDRETRDVFEERLKEKIA